MSNTDSKAPIPMTEGQTRQEEISQPVTFQNLTQLHENRVKAVFDRRVDVAVALNRPEPLKLDYVLPGFVVGTVGGIVAPGATGKSIWTLEAAIAIACDVAGGNLLGLNIPKNGPVLVLAGEDPADAIDARLTEIGMNMGAEAKMAIARNLTIIPAIGGGLDLTDSTMQRQLRALASGKRLLVIDTLTRFHGLDENNASDAKEIMGAMEAIAADTGTPILYVHHVSKAAAMGGITELQQAARGSSVLVDNARWISFLSGMSKDEAEAIGIPENDRRFFVRWNISKQNYSEGTSDSWYERRAGGILFPSQIGADSKSTKEIAAPRRTSCPSELEWARELPDRQTVIRRAQQYAPVSLSSAFLRLTEGIAMAFDTVDLTPIEICRSSGGPGELTSGQIASLLSHTGLCIIKKSRAGKSVPSSTSNVSASVTSIAGPRPGSLDSHREGARHAATFD